jgi:hypothetical protein
MAHTTGDTVAVNTFRMRPGIPSSRFAEFSAQVDQPTCLAFTEVVRSFEAYRVAGVGPDGLGVDIVEVMRVSSWEDWVAVRDHDPSMSPVVSGFDELVDPASVRSSLVVPILRGR